MALVIENNSCGWSHEPEAGASGGTSYPCSGVRAALLILLMMALLPTPLPAQTAPAPTEYHVKAAFLYNFAKYIEWPATAFAGNPDRLLICVLGEDPFGNVLDELVGGRTVLGRRTVVRRFTHAEDAQGCHILFVSSSEENRIDPILRIVGKWHILTVGETDQFALRGGVIRFVTESNRARLEINMKAAEQAQLTVSAQLLKLAQIVVGGSGKRGG